MLGFRVVKSVFYELFKNTLYEELYYGRAKNDLIIRAFPFMKGKRKVLVVMLKSMSTCLVVRPAEDITALALRLREDSSFSG